MKWLKFVGIGVGIVALLMLGCVGYAVATADELLAFEDESLLKIAASQDPEVIERGKYLVHGPAHCASCHSTDDRDHPEKVKTSPLSGGLEFAMGPLGTRYAANLTSDPETGLGKISDGQIARAIRTGVTHTGELSFFMKLAVGRLSDEDLTAVISYLRSVGPVRNEVPRGEWKWFGKVLMTYAFPPLDPNDASGPKHVPPSEKPNLERGKYLVEHVALCGNCHTAFDMNSLRFVGKRAAGSLPDRSHGSDSDMEYVAPNLTSDPTGITGMWTEDAFVQRLHAGRVHKTSIMPWECFEKTTEADLRSIYRYLKSLPAVKTNLGPSYRKAGWEPGKG